jgi:protein TonB
LLTAVAVLLPLLATNTLPAQQWVDLLLEPPPPAAAAPAPRAPEQRRQMQPKPQRADDSVFRTPAVIPERAALLTDEEGPQPGPDETYRPIGVVGAPPGVPGGLLAFGNRQLEVKPPPAPAPSRSQEAAPRLVEVGGKVQAAKLVRKAEPVYPPIARQARISGTVRLEAIIAADGGIRELRVISGHPLLVQSALDAVRQWRYQPTLLNNMPVEVLTHIDVNYTLR